MKKILLLSVGVLIFSEVAVWAGEATTYNASLGNTLSAKGAGVSDAATGSSSAGVNNAASTQSVGLGSTISDKK